MRSLTSLFDDHRSRHDHRDIRFIALRPIRPEDREAFTAFLRGLGDRTRSLRFLTQKNRFTARELDYLCEVDQDRHVAWVAIDLSTGREQIVGEARFVRLADEPGVAEFGIAIADVLQGNGLGGKLMRVLGDEAARLGLGTPRGFVRSDNAAMIGFLDRRGGRKQQDHRDVLRIGLPVTALARASAAA